MAEKMPPEFMAHAAELFHLMGDATRLAILQTLMSGPKPVNTIVDLTGKGQANVSKHLGNLAQAGLVARTKQGTQVIYEIADPFVYKLCDLVCAAVRVRLTKEVKAHQALLNPSKKKQTT